MSRIIWGQAIDKGLLRSTNEDALFAWSLDSQTEKSVSIGLFIVADGFGGGNAGIFASRLAINTTSSYLMSFITTQVRGGQNNEVLFEAMTYITREANLHIIEQSKHDPELMGAVSTIDIVLLTENMAYIAHVGDSRVYLVTKNEVKQTTKDHRVYRTVTPGYTASPSFPYRWLGLATELEIDTSTHTLDSDTHLLLCTDGLLIESIEEGTLDKPILEIIRNNPDPQLACEMLIDYANANGGLDNTAVILVKVVD